MPSSEQELFDFDSLEEGALVHLCGIAGSAMSGLALVLRQRGFTVQGTDPNGATVGPRLAVHGISVHPEQDGRHLRSDVRLVIATAAVPFDHPELVAARARGFRVLRYAEALGALSATRDTLAVAGTHGKTTTSSMAVWILRSAGRDPGFVIGGTVRGLEQGAHYGSDAGFVAEACEYRRSFLELYPRRAIITNIEADHLDVYRDIEEIEDAFLCFARRLGPRGLLVFDADDERTEKVARSAGCRRASYGMSERAELRAVDVEAGLSATAFTAVWHDQVIGRFTLLQPGTHNVVNALGASLACQDMGVSLAQALTSLSSFPGAHRRFEVLGQARDVVVVDDYAHHPTELRALIGAARQRFPGRRLVCAFQPHQSSRTRLLFEDFAAALCLVDLALIVDIYSVRDAEAEVRAVSAEALRHAISAAGGNAKTVGAMNSAHEVVARELVRGDAVLCVGAGPMDALAAALLARLES